MNPLTSEGHSTPPTDPKMAVVPDESGADRPTADENLRKRKRRCFHRAISGIERGGELRFVTLTSEPHSPNIQKSFRKLYMRLLRRNLIEGYMKVPEYNEIGNLIHLHMLFRGSYIHQRLLSYWWKEIHNAPVVYIQKYRQRYRSKASMANYMAKYMTKEFAGRYSWSWGWVWRGFAKHWTWWKQWYNTVIDPFGTNYQRMITGWKLWLHGFYTVNLYALEHKWTLKQTVQINHNYRGELLNYASA